MGENVRSSDRDFDQLFSAVFLAERYKNSTFLTNEECMLIFNATQNDFREIYDTFFIPRSLKRTPLLLIDAALNMINAINEEVENQMVGEFE